MKEKTRAREMRSFFSFRLPPSAFILAFLPRIFDSKLLLLRSLQTFIRQWMRFLQRKVLDILQHEGRRVPLALGFDAKEVRALHIAQEKRRGQLRFQVADLDIAHLDSFDVTNIETVGRNQAEHRRLRVIRLFLRRVERGLLNCSAALIIDAYVAHLHVFDVVTGNAADDRAVSRIGVIDDDVANDDAPQLAHAGRLCWPTKATAQAQEEGSVADVAHGDIRDGHVFEQTAVNSFESETATIIENTV